MFSKILNYPVFKGSKYEVIKYIKSMDKVHIISGNPEVLSNGLKDNMLYENFMQESSLIIPDGVGTIIASKIVKEPVKEKIAGIELMEDLIKVCEKESKGIYLLGTKDEVLDKCIHNLKLKYPKLEVLGRHNGFFDLDNCNNILEHINLVKPYALFVAMGSPRQEAFISRYMDMLNCHVFMGVGGSVDVIAGTVKRAPRWMINVGMEWLYRVLKQPTRIKRLSSIPKFLLKVINNR